MTEPMKPPKKVFFSIPMGWADMKAEERHAAAKDIARRILAVAPPGAMPPSSP